MEGRILVHLFWHLPASRQLSCFKLDAYSFLVCLHCCEPTMARPLDRRSSLLKVISCWPSLKAFGSSHAWALEVGHGTGIRTTYLVGIGAPSASLLRTGHPQLWSPQRSSQFWFPGPRSWALTTRERQHLGMCCFQILAYLLSSCAGVGKSHTLPQPVCQ